MAEIKTGITHLYEAETIATFASLVCNIDYLWPHEIILLLTTAMVFWPKGPWYVLALLQTGIISFSNCQGNLNKMARSAHTWN